MPYIEVGQENSAPIQIYYEDHGSGQPVIMIHGYPFSQRAWEKEAAVLLNEGFRTIRYDRRGFGQSSQPAIGYDYDTFVADLDALITTLDLHDMVLVGHSMGTGEVTHYIATRGSSRVSKGVLISPIPPFLLKTDDNPTGVDKSVFDDIQQAVAQDRFAYLAQFNDNFFNTDENLGKSVSQETLQGHWNIAAMASPKATYDCVQAWLTDFRPDLPKLDVPILIIQGEEDRILPYASTGKLLPGLIQDCKLVSIPGASHGIPWTHAETISRELLQFMRET